MPSQAVTFEQLARRPLVAGTGVMVVAVGGSLATELGSVGAAIVAARVTTIAVFGSVAIGVGLRWLPFRAGERLAWLGGFALNAAEIGKILAGDLPRDAIATSLDNMVAPLLLITYVVWPPAVARRIGIGLAVAAMGSIGWLLGADALSPEYGPVLTYSVVVLAMCEGIIARTRVATNVAAIAQAEADLGRTDQLTGLDNRRGILPRLDRMRPGDAVLIIDVDHFKRVNDEHGHDTGDAVLRRIAALLAAQVREGDAIGRWGGEEFVVVTGRREQPDGHERPVDGAALAGRLCDAVRHDRREPDVTVSIGVAWSRAQDTDWQDALRRADERLYAAKRDGRDRVVTTSPDAGDTTVQDSRAA